MMAHVESTVSAGDSYLTPVKMQDFRLETGAPVYIDFKSIPYRDGDVLEWYRRIKDAEQFYETLDCTQVMMFAEEGVTHIVLEVDSIMQCPLLELDYQDEHYSVYRITNERTGN